MSVRIDRAFVLRRFVYGETSLVVHVLSPEFGRVHLLAKGAYRPTSRYFAVLDFFDTLELEWSHAPNRELETLREGRIVERRLAIARDLDCYRAALSMLELSALAAQEAERARGLFELVRRSLDRLAGEDARPRLELSRFELGFLGELGLAPALSHCASCGREAPPSTSSTQSSLFSPGAGGRLCRRCGDEARGAGRKVFSIATRTLELAAAIARNAAQIAEDASSAPPAAISEAELEKVRAFVVRFLEYHLESRPKSYRRPLARRPARSTPSAAS